MKVLWITNGPFSHHFSLLGKEIPPSSSGSWLYAAYESAKRNGDIKLHIATVTSIENSLFGTFENVNFYILPGGSIYNYNIKSMENVKIWNLLKENVSPDLVVVWGSESRFSYLAMRVFDDVPKIIYVQGVMNSIVKHLSDGVPETVKYSTVRDYLDIINPKQQNEMFKKQAILEQEMFKMAEGAIVENDWCESQCLAMNDKLKIYYNKLPIRQEFFRKKWNIDTAETYSIFTNAGGVPYKGHHVLFQALAIVKQTIPNVKLYIPGSNYLKSTDNIKHRTGYFNWLHKIYKDNRLDENIVFTGILNVQEMADYLSRCNIFVLPSMVENHSSSLIEAMVVGCPCITSLVGGVASIVHHMENGIVYNSLEHNTLAGYILRLLKNNQLCVKFSNNSLLFRETRDGDFGKEMNRIYGDF